MLKLYKYEKNLILSVLLVSACHSEPISTSTTENPKITTEKLFSIDSTYTPGVYRFGDGVRYHYFVISAKDNCVISTLTEGKSTIEETIETK